MRIQAYDGVGMPSRTAERPLLVEVPELRLGLVVLAVAAAAAACARTGAGVPVGLVVLCSLAAAGSLALPPRLAGLTGLAAWAFLTGFVVHTAGRLTFDRADLVRLGVVLTVSLIASALAHGVRVMGGASPHMHVGSPRPIGLGDAQHLAGDRRDLADAEEEEAQQLGDRVPLGPLEVDVRDHPGAVAHVQQQ